MSYVSKIQEKRLKWGGRVLAVKMPAYGNVSMVGSVAGGERFAGSEEFAGVHAAMLMEGTSSRSKSDIQLALDRMGATLSFSSGSARLLFSGRVRSKHIKEYLALVAEVLREPTFPDSELAVLKAREAADLTYESQDPGAQVGIGLGRLLFASGHPNCPETTEESRAILEGTSRESLALYHERIISGHSLVLSFAGDMTLAKAAGAVDRAFRTLPMQKVLPLPFKQAKLLKPRRSKLVLKEKGSISFAMGCIVGITDIAKEYPALVLGLHVLGNGGFTSRLMREVRDREGLTYGVSCGLSGIDQRVDGYIVATGTFAPQLLAKGRASMLREIRAIAKKGVSEEEVSRHAKLFEARSRVALSSTGALARAAHSALVDGKPILYIERFPRLMLRLTAKEVNAALKKYLKPEQFSEFAAGPVGKI